MGEGELGGREKRSGKTPLEAEEPGLDEGNPLWKSIEGNRGDGGQKCFLREFSTRSAGSCLPCQPEDPDSLSLRIIDGAHLLL